MGKETVLSRYPPIGAAFENIVLKNTKKLFQPSKKGQPSIFGQNYLNKQKRSSIYNNDKPLDFDEDDPEHKEKSVNENSFWWASPPQDNLAVEFCQDTTIHGLKFVTQKKRHMSERIFWIIAFILGVTAAVILINDVWKRYRENPVIVSFQPKEQDIDTIPFPAVTFCNINKFPKSKVLTLEELAKSSSDEKVRQLATEQLVYVRSVCNAQQSFAKDLNFSANRGIPDDAAVDDEVDRNHQDDMVEFIRDETIPCNQLIRLCRLGERPVHCDKIFRPIVTDFGKCCTFNMLPLPLLHIDLIENDTNAQGKPKVEKKQVWSKKELEAWGKWHYEEGLVMTDKTLKFPFRQKRAGMPYGLSLLVDPNLDQYYCPAADSVGFRFILHTPLEMPHVMEFASILDVGKEFDIEVHPDVTNAG